MPKGIISSREQNKQFDLAVRDVVRQRKVQQQLQLAVQQEKKLQQQQQKNEVRGAGGRKLPRQATAIPRNPTSSINSVHSSNKSSSFRATPRRLSSVEETPCKYNSGNRHDPPPSLLKSDDKAATQSQPRRRTIDRHTVSLTSSSNREDLSDAAHLSIHEPHFNSERKSQRSFSSKEKPPENRMLPPSQIEESPCSLQLSQDCGNNQKTPPQDIRGYNVGDCVSTIVDSKVESHPRRSHGLLGDGADSNSGGTNNINRSPVRKVSQKWTNLADTLPIIPPYRAKETTKERDMGYKDQMGTEELLGAALNALNNMNSTSLSPCASHEDGVQNDSITSCEGFRLNELVPSRSVSLVRKSSKNSDEIEAAYMEGCDQSKARRSENMSKSQTSEASIRDEEGKRKEVEEPYYCDNLEPSTLASSADVVLMGKEQQQQKVDQEDPPTSQRVPSIYHDDDPRSQFVSMKGQAKSNSDGTGKTKGTSSSSLFSSRGSSIGEINPTNNSFEKLPPSRAATFNPVNNTESFGAIKEEEKDHNTSGECVYEQRHEVLPVEVSKPDGSFPEKIHISLDEDPPGGNIYRRRQSSRIKKIRKSIQNSLRGAHGRGEDARSKRGEEGGGLVGESRANFSNEGGSQAGGSAISAEQQELVSRHLHRKSSTHSITSAFSSFSAMARSNDNSSRASNASSRGSIMSRFRINGVRPRMPKAHSDRSSRRNAFKQYTTSSNVSDLSVDDSSHRSLFTTGSLSSQFTDFYDNNNHVRAVSSVVSSKRISSRLVSSLETVNEPSGGEAKHDEDYHNQCDMLESSNCFSNEPSAYQLMMKSGSILNDSMTFYRHPSHECPMVHLRPNELFPDSPGWQCDICSKETSDMENVKAYISTGKNYVICERCMHTVTKS